MNQRKLLQSPNLKELNSEWIQVMHKVPGGYIEQWPEREDYDDSFNLEILNHKNGTRLTNLRSFHKIKTFNFSFWRLKPNHPSDPRLSK